MSDSQDVLLNDFLFASPVYLIEKQQFLETISHIAEEYLSKAKQDKELDSTFPVFFTENFASDQRTLEFSNYIAQTAWNILNTQGYAMDSYSTMVTDMWAQEHHTRSGNEEHVHGFGSQMTGFYILEAPENCSRIVVHDPRSGKKLINLPERDASKATVASLKVNYEPKAGQLYFMNSYIPHEFTRSLSEKPLKFIHFNVTTAFYQAPINPSTSAEII